MFPLRLSPLRSRCSPLLTATLLALLAFGTSRLPAGAQNRPESSIQPKSKTVAEKIVERAREEVRKKTIYRETYEVLAYPMGDVPPGIGVCTDMVIRSFRNADIDLQKLVHEDRVAHPDAYPTHIWENKKADKNIDHRRCQNLVCFFKRFADPVDKADDSKWKAGDVIFFVHEGQTYPWHVGILSGERDLSGTPTMLHGFPPIFNEDIVTRYGPIHSIYRWKESPKGE